MNNILGDVVMDNDTIKIVTNDGLATLTSAVSSGQSTWINTGVNASTITMSAPFDMEEFLEQHIMNRVTIDHKVAEHELMKLKEHAPDYANEIKENLAKNATRDIMKKLTFTKKHDKDADVHHFIGRAWVFTEEELKNLIKEVRNA